MPWRSHSPRPPCGVTNEPGKWDTHDDIAAICTRYRSPLWLFEAVSNGGSQIFHQPNVCSTCVDLTGHYLNSVLERKTVELQAENRRT